MSGLDVSSTQVRADRDADSLSPKTLSPKPRLDMPNTLTKAKSVSNLPKVSMQRTTDSGLNTLPDPRTPTPPRLTRDLSHPDLSNEVAMLSTKLVNAINHQTTLDDNLQHSRHELEATRRKLAEAEAKCERYSRMFTSGIVVKKADTDIALNKIKDELAEAQKQRDISEKGRKEMEVELENLTSALFEEANTMVSAARKETEATEKRNAQLRLQLNDTELLLASQQEQLADLKGVMEKMSEEQEETDTLPRPSTAPSTPGPDTANTPMFDSFPMSPNTPAFNETPPDQPLRFTHLITPVMRSDLQSYGDFVELLKVSRIVAPQHSRDSSSLSTPQASSSSAMASSSPNVPGSFSTSVTSSPRDSQFQASLPPLKDHKFFKRCLVEDIEPALRLDLAPGLSWLARRTVISSITTGTLVIEPFIPQSKFYGNVYACSLCGESRRTEPHARRHRFRTSEDEAAQRYPLCEYCLGRVRATCDFLGFLRMVRDGLWRARTDEDVSSAWEECIRLREKMFWCRVGGGVVPVIATRTGSPVASQRRQMSSLLHRTSSDFSTTAKSSVDEGARAGAEAKGLALEVPKLHEIPGSRLREGSTPADEELEGSRWQDFATPNNTRPTTPAYKVEAGSQKEVDDSSTTSSRAKHENELENAEVESLDAVAGSTDESAATSSIPGSFD